MERDQRAMKAIYDQYGRALFAVIHTILRQEELSRDVFQEALVKMWKSSSTYDTKKGRLYTWMLNICRNQAIDTSRSKAFKLDAKIQKDVEYVDIEKTEYTTHPDHIGVNEMPNVLSQEQKDLVDLIYFKGYTQKEASDQLKMPLGTIKTRIRAAIKTLKDHFN